MKKLALLLVLAPLYAHGTAPFGLDWGEDVSRYGEVKRQGDELRVETHALPKSLSLANDYVLYADKQHGLLKVIVTSKIYGLYDDDYKEDFNFIKQSLLDTGYQTTQYFANEMSSYKCVLQVSCSGKRWYGAMDDGTNVSLEQLSETREDGYIRMTFKSPRLLQIEAEREELKQLKQKNKNHSDRLAFG
ncbi:hypothetical protein [Shewanella sp. Isolate7]|uniref:hypothetical protein n=1 Tax=Shewanella sp. Isolate7 TaxID=2908528 RepID=UPI001EFD2591|nr:hypothetical protein [Shewanella sp. Isolate7]MCG9723236.1 hypothetical protein [Shewanella sp. Isolate7]